MTTHLIQYLLLFCILFLPTSVTAEVVTGTVIAGGEESTISFETNLLQAQNVTIDDVEFEITMIDGNLILAGNESLEIGIVFGDRLKGVLQCSKEVIVQQFQIENIDELKCSNTSKGFFYLKTADFTIGNCIN